MRLIEVNYLRLFAITSILLWHCLVCPAVYWNVIPQSEYTKCIALISSFAMPEANMPLFTCLSGFLFSFLFYSRKNKYISLKSIFVNKIHRLVIPFFVLGTIANLLVAERDIKDIIWGNGSSLWFCMMLFWCTMIRSVVLFYKKRWLGLSILSISILMIITYGSNYSIPREQYGLPLGLLGFNRGLYFYTYFVLGDILYKVKDKIGAIPINNVITATAIYLTVSISLYLMGVAVRKL